PRPRLQREGLLRVLRPGDHRTVDHGVRRARRRTVADADRQVDRLPGVVVYSAPSVRATAARRRPIRPPPTAPTSLSSGKWIPAHSRESLASCASAARSAASAGKRWPSTAAAAAEMVECPEVYEGKGGVGRSTSRLGSAVIGRAVQ